MDLNKLTRRTKKYLQRELHYLMNETSILHDLRNEVREIRNSVNSTLQTRHLKSIIEHFTDEARRDEKYSEKIEWKLDTWIRRIDRLLNEEETKLNPEGIKQFEKIRTQLKVCKANLEATLSWNGELHQAIKKENNWEEITSIIKKAIGDDQNPGINSLLVLIRSLEEIQKDFEKTEGRRKFMIGTAATIGGVYATAGFGTWLIGKKEKQLHDTNNFTLKQLVNEKDYQLPAELIDYKGFPTRIKKAQFQLMKINDKRTKREVIIFAEEHYHPRYIIELIDLLVERYGFDSIGLENFYGAPSTKLADRRNAEVKTKIGNTIIKGTTTKEGAYMPDTNIGEFPRSDYIKYLSQEIVPTYGIEGKEEYMNTLSIVVYNTAIKSLLSLARDKYSHNIHSIPPVILKQLEEIIQRLKKKNKHLKFPVHCPYIIVDAFKDNTEMPNDFNYFHKTFHEDRKDKCNFLKEEFNERGKLAAYLRRIKSEFEKLDELQNENLYDHRNIAIAKNIPKIMRKIGSKKSIVIIGAAHVYSDIGNKFVQQHGDKHGFDPNSRVIIGSPDKELQKLLKLTSVSINASGTKI